MICVVLGAGATRGASFASEGGLASKPPLDADFFCQAQMTGEGGFVDEVLPIIRQLFGVARDVSLERAFSALDQGIKLEHCHLQGRVESNFWRPRVIASFVLYRGFS
jgi:hypothetical protein